MAKVITSSVKYSGGAQVSRPGVHAKSKTSRLKTSKHYKKSYRGQGR